jgi:hypothetical protein
MWFLGSALNHFLALHVVNCYNNPQWQGGPYTVSFVQYTLFDMPTWKIIGTRRVDTVHRNKTLLGHL